MGAVAMELIRRIIRKNNGLSTSLDETQVRVVNRKRMCGTFVA